MTDADYAAVMEHNERFVALKRLVASFEDQNTDPKAIIMMLQNRIDNLRQKERQDVIDDLADTLNSDREYRYSVASDLVTNMTDEEVSTYRADYLNHTVDEDLDDAE